jgi:hypothetical protein
LPSYGPFFATTVAEVTSGVANEQAWAGEIPADPISGQATNLNAADTAEFTVDPWYNITDGGDPPAITGVGATSSKILTLTNMRDSGAALPSIPASEYVTNVSVTVRMKRRDPRHADSEIRDSVVMLTLGTEDKAIEQNLSSSYENRVYSFTPAEWGATDLYSAYNASTWGVKLALEGVGGPYPAVTVDDEPIAYLDLVSVTITTAEQKLFVDSVKAKWCYEVPSAGADIKHQYVSFSPLGIMLAMRSSGHVDEIEWDHSLGAYIEGTNRDGGRQMPDGFWESQEFRGGNRRLNMVGLDKGADDAVDVTAECDRGSSTQTLSAGDRHARFPVTQQGYSHKVRIEVSEDTDGIERCQMWFTDLSDGWKR